LLSGTIREKERSLKGRRNLITLGYTKKVIEKLKLGWSPPQIAGRMKLERRVDRVCHETIYAWLYTDEWAYKEEKLYQYLRRGQKRRSKWRGRGAHKDKIPNRISIHKRPEIASKRIEFGHFEGDSVIYPDKYAISTQNELLTGLVQFRKLERKTAKATAKAQARMLKKYQVDKMPTITITYDNGCENTQHQFIANATGVGVYFADPYSSYQRGANENANGLLRSFLPKRTNISSLTQQELDDIAWELNHRPRKRLGYRTPMEVYNLLVSKERFNCCICN
jgi:IS30 family transposase